MANWGAFSRDFAAAANSTARTVGGLLEDRARLDLAANADKRAAASAAREAQSAADARAAAAAELGDMPGVAEKAAGIPPPNKMGGPKDDSSFNIGSDDYIPPARTDPKEVDPALNEEYEAGLAKTKGFTPAPPSAVPPQKAVDENVTVMAPPDELGGPKDGGSVGGIPKALIDLARKGNTAAAARIRELKAQALEQSNKDRDFNERKRVNDSNLETAALERQRTKQLLSKEDYDQAKLKVADYSKTALSLVDNVKAAPDTPLSDPAIKPYVDKLVDTLDQGYDATPDGRSLQITNNNGTYVVKTIEDATGREISTDTFKTWGELQGAAMMFGQIAQGDNLGKWMGAASLDATRNAVRGTKAQAEVNAFLDKAGGLSDEERLKPEVQAQLKQEMATLSAKYPDETTEIIEVPVKDAEGNQLFDNNNRPVVRKEKRNKLAYSMDLLQPNTKVTTAKGTQVEASAIIEKFLQNPAPYIAEAGDLPSAMVALRERLAAGGLEPGVADILTQQAAARLPQAIQGALAKTAVPNGVQVPGRVPAGLPPQAAPFNPRGAGVAAPPTVRPIGERIMETVEPLRNLRTR